MVVLGPLQQQLSYSGISTVLYSLISLSFSLGYVYILNLLLTRIFHFEICVLFSLLKFSFLHYHEIYGRFDTIPELLHLFLNLPKSFVTIELISMTPNLSLFKNYICGSIIILEFEIFRMNCVIFTFYLRRDFLSIRNNSLSDMLD